MTLHFFQSKTGPSIWSQFYPEQAGCVFPPLSGICWCSLVPLEKGEESALLAAGLVLSQKKRRGEKWGERGQ